MKTTVITGSTRGIGYGLAEAFLDLGCAVTVSGRSSDGVKNAADSLGAKHDASRVFGHRCDVTDYDQVQALWDTALEHWGKIDIWINNAGMANLQMAFWEQPTERIQAVVQTNLVGAMYGAKVAIPGMLKQGFGELYNMEGLGSDGRKVEGLTLYGSTKHGLRYLTDALAQETHGTSVLVGALSPGMVVTDLLTQQYDARPEDFEQAKHILNVLADRVETVTPWLAQQVLNNEKNGAHITWLTRRKTMSRFLMAPFRKRDVFD